MRARSSSCACNQASAEFHAGGRQFLALGNIETTADIAGKSAHHSESAAHLNQ